MNCVSVMGFVGGAVGLAPVEVALRRAWAAAKFATYAWY